MSRIYIDQKHDFSDSEARQIANEIAEKLADSYNIEYQWQDDVLYFERSGVYGQIEIDADDIVIQAELSFPLSLLQSQVESQVREILQTHFLA